MPLKEYVRKRDFKHTPEPRHRKPGKKAKGAPHMFVVQEHHASHLHYDFRLELNGVLKSWAVPKGPSLDPKTKRLAVQVEDHPVSYGDFEGTIPEGHYGGGNVYIWDTGTWEPTKPPREGLKAGRLEFTLHGERLKGEWVLVRTSRGSAGKEQWLLIKRSDEFAQAGHVAEEIGTDAKPSKISKPVKKKLAKKKVSKKKSPKLSFVEPQLAQLVEAPPPGSEWLHETKYDGYRTQALLQDGEVKLLTRSGLNWTAKYQKVARSLGELSVEDAILDGEIVWLDDEGRTDFQLLQNALKEGKEARMVYYVFDLLHLNGQDLRDQPLRERKKLLQELLKEAPAKNIRFGDHLEGSAKEFFQAACDHRLEGIISKRKDGTYYSGRGSDWLKSKCKEHQEFVIGGFTEGTGARSSFGALLVGVYDKGKLRYAGKVGTGFTQKSIQDLRKKLLRLEQDKSPFDLKSPRERGTHWVRPELVAEVTFANWTTEQILRTPVFHGLREDKKAREIRKEKALKTAKVVEKVLKEKPQASAKKAKPTPSAKEKLAISSPDKILFAKEKITKLQVAQYYQDFAHIILPYLKDRPLSLKRCPEGTGKACFFQKHATGKIPPELNPIDITEKSGKKVYMTADSAEGLLALSQMSAFELHVWGSKRNEVEHPSDVVIDFDPGPGVGWKQVVDAAFSLKEILDALSLKSFVNLSGGKGVHVHIPIAPIYSWDQIKEFALTLGKEMVRREPDLYTVSVSKKDRNKKIFVDYLRNGRGSTAIVPYSLRARPVSAVAMPVSWTELKKVKSPDQFTLAKAYAHLKKRRTDPWKDFFKKPQKISILKSKK